jgi:acetolactate synthase-1/2/3 large subunit
MDELFAQLPEEQITVTGNGSACVTSFQTADIKQGQRLWTNSGCATMGYDLPASIGAHKASGGKSIICLAGDGSIMMNLQELQTIAGNGYPIKIFILNNSGYVSIFQTHRNFFNGVEVGGGPKSGVTFPSFEKLSKAFDLPYRKVLNHAGMKEAIEQTLSEKGPCVCEIMIDENVSFAPKLGAKQHPDGRITSPPLEDLSPFLSREVLRENMIIDSPAEE